MSIIPKLINPTPFLVEFPYERGIKIRVEPDGESEISVGQMDDFRSGKPGSEAVRTLLEYYGLFLFDSDLSYDLQALRGCQASLKAKKAQYKDFIERTRTARLSQNASVDDETMRELIVSANYHKIEKQIEVLEKRVNTLQEVIGSDETRGKVKETLDPKRTCFITTPPRQFLSETALRLFLEENPEIKEKHDAYAQEL